MTNNNGSKIEADDIIQETIIAVFEKIKDNRFKLNSDTKLSTFLFAVGKYKWYNELRKRRVMTPFPTENGFDLEDDLENYYLKEERYEQLKRLIERLDEVCRQILKERYWLRKKFEEIKISSCRSVDALKMKSSRCHKQLRELHG
ncbi:MAG: sigma-70 family RNA polymerase sigma factor [Bacteroidetes bacterium]|nr:sigma-70 family RNA polymerase sigma factor [Bacteroidota bacterium]